VRSGDVDSHSHRPRVEQEESNLWIGWQMGADLLLAVSGAVAL
jgi:hypothetical protein